VIILGAVVGFALFVPLAVTHQSAETRPEAQFVAPGRVHPMGTDHLGRDVLARVAVGAQHTLFHAALASCAALLIGLCIGGISGGLGGVLDWLLMRGVDILLAFPGLLLALSLVAMLGQAEWQAAVAVGVALSPILSRMVRAAVLSVRSHTYIDAAVVAGGSRLWIVWHHFLPVVAAQVATYMTVIMAWALLNMAALDFLGVSGSPSIPTWGRMLAEGRSYLRVAPWIALWPGTFLTLTVVAVTGLSGAWRQSPVEYKTLP
jgi:peptide/nickel transport system permease protein